MFPAEHEVGHHDEDRRQHGGTGGEVDGGVHHLLHRFRAEAVDHQHREHEDKLPPGGAHRHAVLVELGGLLAVNPCGISEKWIFTGAEVHIIMEPNMAMNSTTPTKRPTSASESPKYWAMPVKISTMPPA